MSSTELQNCPAWDSTDLRRNSHLFSQGPSLLSILQGHQRLFWASAASELHLLMLKDRGDSAARVDINME